jgi:pimeloyl-ACP methyl ester carboxylesterase
MAQSSFSRRSLQFSLRTAFVAATVAAIVVCSSALVRADGMKDFPRPTMVSANGIHLAVYETGSELPVVLCHGFPELAYLSRHQLPALAEAGYHAIAPDQRGYAASDRPERVEAYSIDGNWELTKDRPCHIDVPCLYVGAEDDVVLPPSSADGMEKFIPNLEKATINACGHWAQQEQPEKFNQLVVDWLKCHLPGKN